MARNGLLNTLKSLLMAVPSVEQDKQWLLQAGGEIIRTDATRLSGAARSALITRYVAPFKFRLAGDFPPRGCTANLLHFFTQTAQLVDAPEARLLRPPPWPFPHSASSSFRRTVPTLLPLQH